jgi:riboflavin kinase/FMN adenylyltransferase
MKIYNNINQIQFNKKRAITLGTFDGIHLGHLSIIQSLTENAKAKNLDSMLITFEPHPQIYFAKSLNKKNDYFEKFPLLTTTEEKLNALNKMNYEKLIPQNLELNEIFVIEFNQEVANLSAKDFIIEFLAKKIGFSHFTIGFNHNFGKNREGNFEFLSSIQKEISEQNFFEINKVSPKKNRNENISSTQIRKLLLNNEKKSENIERANELLGYEYFAIGKVVEGNKIGRQLGFPTANIEINSENKLLPQNGVYFCSIEFLDEKKVKNKHFGVANLGFRPTISQTNSLQKVLEIHILNFTENIYNEKVKVNFIKFIRAEKKFESKEKLIEQIQKDIKNVGLDRHQN